MNAPGQVMQSQSSEPHPIFGYRDFKLGEFEFKRDEYFAHIHWPKRHATRMDIDDFLRALMRDVAWGFFYGTVNFDQVFGTTNHYGEVDMFAGRYNEALHGRRRRVWRTSSDELMANLQGHARRLDQRRLRPVRGAAGDGRAWGARTATTAGDQRACASARPRMVGLTGDTPVRTDSNGYPVNRHVRRRAAGPAGGPCRARLRARGAGLQPVRLPVALGRDLEPVGHARW